MKNILKTYLLIGLLTALLLMVGGLIGGQTGVVVALVFSLVFNVISLWYSDKIVLSMYKAEEIKRGDASGLYEMVEKLARKAGIPMPKVYIIPEMAPNAFATGRSPKHAAVAATQGLLKNLSNEEIEAVLAHEVTHIKNRDTQVQTMVAVIASAIMHLTMLARLGALFGMGGRDENDRGGLFTTILLIIVAPIAAVLIQAAISRSREYMADKGSKNIIGSGTPLSNALRKIDNVSKRGVVMESATQETSHMFIMNPLSGKSLLGLFSTHPATEDRIQKLLYE
ncbi:MAG: zinc metalloprotease HtpX [Pseudomonadota bacterium]